MMKTMGMELTQFLSPEAADFWHKYLAAEAQDKRKEALATLDAFLTAFAKGAEEQRHHFAETFCRQTADEGQALPLRQPFFAAVIGPYLVSAFQSGTDVAYWLAYFHLHFLTMPPAQKFVELPHFAPIDLLQGVFRRDPDNIPAQELLIQTLANQFSYAVHEVPSGVLYGADGATVEECREWERDLELFRAVVQKRAVAEKYKDAIPYWQFHFHGYADYLLNRSQYENYADYIRLHTGS